MCVWAFAQTASVEFTGARNRKHLIRPSHYGKLDQEPRKVVTVAAAVDAAVACGAGREN